MIHPKESLERSGSYLTGEWPQAVIRLLTRAWGQAIALVVSAVGIALLVITPPATLSSNHSWTLSNNLSVQSGLLRPSPEAIVIDGECPKGTGKFSEHTIRADNWALDITSGMLRLVTAADGEPTLQANVRGDCRFSFSYVASSKTAQFVVVDFETGALLSNETASLTDLLQFSALEVVTSQSPVFSELTVVTAPWGLTHSPVREVAKTLLLLSVALLSLHIWASQYGQGRSFDITRRPRWSHFNGSTFPRIVNLSVLLGVIGGMLIFPSYYDDGWVLHRVTESIRTGLHSDFYSEGDGWSIQGVWLESVMARLVALGVSLEWLRILFGLAVWVTWLLVRRTMTNAGLLNGRSEHAFFALFYLSFALAFLVTIRPEPVVALLVAVFFLAFSNFTRGGGVIWLLVGGLASALALSAHQSSFVLAGPVLFLLVLAIRQAIRGALQWGPLILSICASFAFLIWLVFFDYDLATLVREYGVWASRDSYVRGESERWMSLWSEPGWRMWPFLLGLLGVLFGSLRTTTMSTRELVLYSATTLAPLGLFLTSSKWTWHLGALAVPLVLGVAYGIRAYRKFSSERGWSPSVLFAPVLGGLILLSVPLGREGILNWNYPVRWFGSGGVAPAVVFGETGFFWELLPVIPVAGAVFGLALRFLPRRRFGDPSFLAFVMIPVIVCGPVASHYGALVLDSVVWDGWTPAKQRVKSLAGVQNCGVLDDLQIVNGALQAATPPPGISSTSAGPFGLHYFPISSNHQGVSFVLDTGAEPVGMWLQGTSGTHQIQVIAEPYVGETEILFTLTPPPGVWVLIELPLRKQWERVTLRDLQGTLSSSPASVTVPATVSYASALEVVGGSVVLAGPGVSTYVPCSREPRKVEGRMEQVDFVVSSDFGLPYRFDLVQGRLIEVGYRTGIKNSFLSLVAVQ